MAHARTHDSSDEYELPAVEAVLAGTLALMTGCAQAQCEVQRRQMMNRIVANMALLADHPQLSDPFRCALAKLRCHWELLLEEGGASPAPAALRHPAPGTLQ